MALRLHAIPGHLRVMSRRRHLSLLAIITSLLLTSALLRHNSATSNTLQEGDGATSAATPLRGYGAPRGLFTHHFTMRSPLTDPEHHSQHQAPTDQSADRPKEADTLETPPVMPDHQTSPEVRSGHQVEPGHDAGRATNASSSANHKEKFSHWEKELEPVDVMQLEPMSLAWLRERERVYEERRATLAAACARLGVRRNGSTPEVAWGALQPSHSVVPVETVKPSHFSVVPQLKTLFCLINKVASTSLLGTFLKIAGHGVPVFTSGKRSPHASAKFLHPKKPGDLETARQEYFKFLFVRHPLERLISAYEDKVVRAAHRSLQSLRRAILNAHEDIFIRQPATARFEEDRSREREIMKDYKRDLAAYRAEVKQRNSVPTFQEFLDFALIEGKLTGDSFDSHWTPYWKQCSPCHIQYDVVGKLDTAADDFKYVWSRLGILDSAPIPWIHSSQSQSRRTSLMDRIRAYLGPLRPDTVRSLREHFRPDFELFGYDWRGMLDAAGHCRPSAPCELE